MRVGTFSAFFAWGDSVSAEPTDVQNHEAPAGDVSGCLSEGKYQARLRSLPHLAI